MSYARLTCEQTVYDVHGTKYHLRVVNSAEKLQGYASYFANGTDAYYAEKVDRLVATRCANVPPPRFCGVRNTSMNCPSTSIAMISWRSAHPLEWNEEHGWNKA